MDLRRLFIVLIGAGFLLGQAQGAPLLAPPVRWQGESYLRLGDWAAAHGLQMSWLKTAEDLQLTRGSSRLALTVDSRQAVWNGVTLWLSFPILWRNGAALLARLDAETALQPLLLPPRDRPGAQIQNICLDPGHGGKDPGYCVGSRQEKTYALLLAQEVQRQLRHAGFKVSLTRNRDRFVELADRPELANRRKADLFISLHFNAAETGARTVQGSQVFCLTPAGASSTNAGGEGGGTASCAGNRNDEKNLLLAYELQKQLTHTLGAEDRGVRRARFAVLRDARMPAVLIEAGFMSHPVEGPRIFTAGYRHELAQAIVAGIVDYKHTVER